MDNLQNAVELITTFLFVVEGSDEIHGLIDRQDVYHTSSTDMIDVDKLLREAKLFLMENR